MTVGSAPADTSVTVRPRQPPTSTEHADLADSTMSDYPAAAGQSASPANPVQLLKFTETVVGAGHEAIAQ